MAVLQALAIIWLWGTMGSFVLTVYCAAQIFLSDITGSGWEGDAGFCGGATGWECVPCLDDDDVDVATKLRCVHVCDPHRLSGPCTQLSLSSALDCLLSSTCNVILAKANTPTATQY